MADKIDWYHDYDDELRDDLCQFLTTDDFYFQIDDESNNNFLDWLTICISPKNYTDKEQCCYDQHLSNAIDHLLVSLPFTLSEDIECGFSVWDSVGKAQLTYLSKKLVKDALLKAGFIERITPKGAAW